MGEASKIHPLTLYELNSLVGDAISITLPGEYWVQAELASVSVRGGHCYLELIQKDEWGTTPVARASGKCWRNTYARIIPKFESETGQALHAGMNVMVRVKADFHAAYGFSWIINAIDSAYSLGETARRKREIMAKLEAEGVADLQKGLPLPPFARRIAVVSSPHAAGLEDFMHHLAGNQRGFKFETELFDSVMQGEGVEKSVISALDRIAGKADRFDAVAIIRGGGGKADLSGFDTLELGENVANFPLPIISGIGHDRDESVVDAVAHTSVKTPTAAADFFIAHLEHTWARVGYAEECIAAGVEQAVNRSKAKIAWLESRINAAFSRAGITYSAQLERAYAMVLSAARSSVAAYLSGLSAAWGKAMATANKAVTGNLHKVELMAKAVAAADPETVLKRGYSITMADGKAVKDASLLKPGQEITTRLAKGHVTSTIK